MTQVAVGINEMVRELARRAGAKGPYNHPSCPGEAAKACAQCLADRIVWCVEAMEQEIAQCEATPAAPPTGDANS